MRFDPWSLRILPLLGLKTGELEGDHVKKNKNKNNPVPKSGNVSVIQPLPGSLEC